jgi:hypothetical protein
LIKAKYGNIDIPYLKETIKGFLVGLDCDKETIDEVSEVLNDIIDNIDNDNYLKKQSHHFSVLHKNKRYKKEQIKKEVPPALIIGGLEAACGALLWITPFRPIGSFMIGDAMRRILNEVQEVSKEREKEMALKRKEEEKNTSESKEAFAY